MLIRFLRTALPLLVAKASLTAAMAACPGENLVADAASAFARAKSAAAFSSAIGQFTDIRSLALFALGTYRAALPPSEEARYVALTKAYMGRFIAEYGNQVSGQLTIQSCNGGIINGRFTGGSNVVFRLGGGGNRIEDVSVAGFSLANNLRDKFVGVIRDNNGSVPALLSYLQR